MARTKNTTRAVYKRITAARMKIGDKPDNTFGKSNKKGRKPTNRSQEKEIDKNEQEAEMSSTEQDEERSEIEMADSGQEESQDDGDNSLQSSEGEESEAAIALSIEESLVEQFKGTLADVLTEEHHLDKEDCDKAAIIFRDLKFLGNYQLRKVVAEAITCLLIEYENKDEELVPEKKKAMETLHAVIKAFEAERLWASEDNSGRIRGEFLELVREVMWKFQCQPTLDGDVVDFYITTIREETGNYEFKSFYHMIIRNFFNDHDFSIKSSMKVFTRMIKLAVIVQFMTTGRTGISDSDKDKNTQGLIDFLSGGPCELFVDKMLYKATNMAIVRLCWIGDELKNTTGGIGTDTSRCQLRGVVLISSDDEDVVHVMSPGKGKNMLTFNKTNAELWNKIARQIGEALQWPAYKVMGLMSTEAGRIYALESEAEMERRKLASEKMKADGEKYRNSKAVGDNKLASVVGPLNANHSMGDGDKNHAMRRQGGADKGKDKTNSPKIIAKSNEQPLLKFGYGGNVVASRSFKDGESEEGQRKENETRVALKYTNMDECLVDERITLLEANIDDLFNKKKSGRYDGLTGIEGQIFELSTELKELRSRAARELSVRSSLIVTTNAYKPFTVRPRLHIDYPYPFSWESEVREKLNAVQVYSNIKLKTQQEEFDRFGVTNILDNIDPFMLVALGGRDGLCAMISIEKVLKTVKDYFNKSQKLNSETLMNLLDMKLYSNENPTASYNWKLTQRVNQLLDAKVEIPYKILIYRLIKHIEYPTSTYFNSRWAVALADNKDAAGDLDTFKRTIINAYEDSLARAGNSNNNKGGGQRHKSQSGYSGGGHSTKYGADQPGGSGGSKRPRGGSEKKLPKDQVLCWNKPCHAKDCEWMHTKVSHPERFPSTK